MMTGSTYFEDMTSERLLWKRAGTPLYQRLGKLPPASDWSTNELFACRVVVNRDRPRVLDFGLPSIAFEPDAELLKIIDPLPPNLEDLAETQLIHQLGGLPGMFWGALHRFTHNQLAIAAISTATSPPDSDTINVGNIVDGIDGIDVHMVDVSGLPSLPSSRPQRVRGPTQNHPEYVDSGTMKVESSSPLPLSSSFGSSAASYVSRGVYSHSADPEDETVQLASAFLRSALVYCPLQSPAVIHNIPCLLEFSGTRRCLSPRFGNGALQLHATPDGEFHLLPAVTAGRFGNPGEVIALLEAKKRFKMIRNGRPMITDDVLGHMVGEAVALRLSLAAQDLDHYEENVVIVAATRQYMCFMSLWIPDEYVQRTRFPDNDLGYEDDDDNDEEGKQMHEGDEVEDGEGGGVGKGPVITISATHWLNLAEQHGRKVACENIAALVRWQQQTL